MEGFAVPEEAPRSEHSTVVQTSQVVENLLRGVGTGERHYSFLSHNAFLVDVEDAVERFDLQLSFLKERGRHYPCIDMPVLPMPIDVVPRDLTLIATSREERKSLLSSAYEWTLNRISAMLPGSSIEEVNTNFATEIFKERLSSFLLGRFSAGSAPNSPGVQVTVNTNSSGLRVHYSPAITFNPANVLNAPTTPVVGWMQPGRYIFGAASPGKAPIFDPYAEYLIPQVTSVFMGL